MTINCSRALITQHQPIMIPQSKLSAKVSDASPKNHLQFRNCGPPSHEKTMHSQQNLNTIQPQILVPVVRGHNLWRYLWIDLFLVLVKGSFCNISLIYQVHSQGISILPTNCHYDYDNLCATKPTMPSGANKLHWLDAVVLNRNAGSLKQQNKVEVMWSCWQVLPSRERSHIPPNWKRKNHLQKLFEEGYVSSQEGRNRRSPLDIGNINVTIVYIMCPSSIA